MSRYARKTWTTDDYVTPTPMNNIETGVLEAVEPLKSCRYNLLSQPYADGTEKEVDNVTFSVSKNGTVHLISDGTGSGVKRFYVTNNLTLDPSETYSFIGCLSTGGRQTFDCSVSVTKSDGTTTLYRDYGGGITFTDAVAATIYCWCYANQTFDVFFSPTLIKSSSIAYGMNVCDFAAKIWRSIQGY